MGAPSSSMFSKIFIQHIQHTYLPRLTHKHKFINYFQYVDDILLIYDSSITGIHTILDDFNSIHPNLQFTEEVEQINLLNYLDITIHKAPPEHEDFNLHKNPRLLILSFHILLTTLYNINIQLSGSYTTD
jgi:hypothetical protein